MANMTTPEAERLLNYYNGLAYDAANNPGGMDNNGHAVNFIPSLRDVASMGLYAATMALIASQYALSSTGWAQEQAAVERVSGSQLTVVGDKRLVYQPNRAISLTQTASGFGYIAGSSYASDTGLTTVTITGITVDSGLTAVFLGQAIENAPCAPSLTNTLYITSNFVTP